jgi:hypothetical protein
MVDSAAAALRPRNAKADRRWMQFDTTPTVPIMRYEWGTNRRTTGINAMKILAAFVVGLGCLLTPAVASAATAPPGVTKTWVSTTGHDTGTCPITAPCQTFQYAHDQTAAGGEIDVKDSGGYGLLTITKSISINAAEGVLALISVPANSYGILVNAGSDDKIVIKGITIDGHSLAGTTGVEAGSKMFISKCVIRNLITGVDMRGTDSSAITSVQDSDLTGNQVGIDSSEGTIVVGNDRFFMNRYGMAQGYNTTQVSFGDNYFYGNSYVDYVQPLGSVSKH